MSLRLRIALASALAVVVAFAIGGVVTYEAARRSLYAEVDDSLRTAAIREAQAAARPDPAGAAAAASAQEQLQADGEDDDRDRERDDDRDRDDRPFGGPLNGRFGGPGIFAELIDGSGTIVRLPAGEDPLPPADEAAEIAARGRGSDFQTIRYEGEPIRVLVVGLRPDLALQVGRSVEDVEGSLERLQRLLLLAGIGGAIIAVALGWLVADRGLVPLRRLAADVDDAAQARDLTRRLPERGGAESARLAAAVNDLMAGLDEARRAQDQLVADAAHELRTPLTALRTDIETLGDPSIELADEDRRQIADALGREIDDVARMVTGIVDLARGARPVERSEDLRLDDLVADVVARARSRRPEAVIELDAEPAAMTGDPTRLERAIANLVENALLHGAAPVHVRVRPGEVVVDDAGPGIPPDQREAMFERFRRGVGGQDRPGSGLGLAIVRQDVAAHGGTVAIGDAPGGGCRITVRLPA
ncbi:MAG: sensor histidine kinase [Actinomycetota bacterium]